MKSLVLITALVVVAFTVPALAAENAPQPLTKAACDQAGMKWNDRANVCGDKKAHHKKRKRKGQGEEEQPPTESAPQPLTRAACDQAGMKWNDQANVCADKKDHDKKKKGKKKKGKKHHDGKKPPLTESAPQPLTRAACDQAGMKWNERANVCGVKKAHDKKKKGKKKQGKKKHGKKHGHDEKHGKKQHGDGDGKGANDKGGFKWPWQKKTKDGP